MAFRFIQPLTEIRTRAYFWGKARLAYNADNLTTICEAIFLCHIAFLRCVRCLLLTANVVPSSPILVTLMMEAPCPSESSVLTRSRERNIPQDGILPFLIAIYRRFCVFELRLYIDDT
jgi:hypothetical protein